MREFKFIRGYSPEKWRDPERITIHVNVEEHLEYLKETLFSAFGIPKEHFNNR